MDLRFDAKSREVSAAFRGPGQKRFTVRFAAPRVNVHTGAHGIQLVYKDADDCLH
jgi:hypothetical protein